MADTIDTTPTDGADGGEPQQGAAIPAGATIGPAAPAAPPSSGGTIPSGATIGPGTAIPAGATIGPVTPPATTAEQPGFWQRTYEGIIKPLVDTGAATIMAPMQRAKQMVESLESGNLTDALQHAYELHSALAPSSPNHPLVKMASDTIVNLGKQATDAARHKADVYQTDRKNGGGVAGSALDAVMGLSDKQAELKRMIQQVNQDRDAGNYSGLLGDALNHAIDENPLIKVAGGAGVTNFDEDLHQHNYRAVAGDAFATGLSLALSMLGGGEAKVADATDAVTGLGRLTRDARTVQDLSEASKEVISEQGLAGSIADTVKAQKGKIDAAFDAEKEGAAQQAEGEKELAAQTLNRDKSAAQIARESAQQSAAGDLTQARQGIADAATQRIESVRDKLQARLPAFQRALEKVKGMIQGKLVDTLDQASAGAIPTRGLAAKADEGINAYESSLSPSYEEGLTGENGVITRLGSQKVAIADSPMSAGAKRIINQPNPATHSGVSDMDRIRGNKLDPDVAQFLTDYANGTKTTGAGANAVTVSRADMSAKDLVDLRQSTMATMRDAYPRGDINRKALGQFVGSIDDTLEGMAKASGDPEVMKDFTKLRDQYRQAKGNLDTNVADKLNLTSPDQGLDDVNNYLLGGNNPLAKVKTMRSIVGNDAMQSFATSKVQQWKRLAEKKPAQFVKEWESLTTDVKGEFFGPDLTKTLQDASDVYTQSIAHAEDRASGGMGAAKTFNRTAVAGARKQATILKDSATAANKTTLNAVNGRYQDAVEVAQDAFDAATKASKATQKATVDASTAVYGVASEPFSGKFMDTLSEGRVNKALLNGQVDVQDIRKVKQAVGTKWDGISDGVFQRALADASPKGRFDPQKLLDWWEGIHPDVRKEMFNLDTPEFAQRYQTMMTSVKDAASTKRLVKAGVLYPASLFGSAAGGTLLGSSQGPLAEAVGMFAGLGSNGVPLVRQFIDSVANHPATWKAVGKVGKVLDSKPAARAAKAATGPAPRAAAAGAYLGAQNSLSGNERQP